jgi:hypothetical protein
MTKTFPSVQSDTSNSLSTTIRSSYDSSSTATHGNGRSSYGRAESTILRTFASDSGWTSTRTSTEYVSSCSATSSDLHLIGNLRDTSLFSPFLDSSRPVRCAHPDIVDECRRWYATRSTEPIGGCRIESKVTISCSCLSARLHSMLDASLPEDLSNDR